VMIIAIHIVMVRLRGVVHPIDADPAHLGSADGHDTAGLGGEHATPAIAPETTPTGALAAAGSSEGER
jgi:hypothetical protein